MVRVATRSKNHRSWETSTTVPRYLERKSSNHSKVSMSRWFVGSSSSSISGPGSTAAARFTTVFCPPERALYSRESSGERRKPPMTLELRSSIS